MPPDPPRGVTSNSIQLAPPLQKKLSTPLPGSSIYASPGAVILVTDRIKMRDQLKTIAPTEG